MFRSFIGCVMALSLVSAVGCNSGGGGSVDSASGAAAGVCGGVGFGCVLPEADGIMICMEILDAPSGTGLEAAFEGDCIDEGGTFSPSGCPAADRTCSIVGTSGSQGTGVTHIYGTGAAQNMACGACDSEGAECC